MIQDLPIPPDAQGADQAVELFRSWMIDEGLHCTLLPSVWKEEPGTWGIVLADAAKHIANDMGEECGLDPQAILDAIREAFLEELELSGELE